MGFEREQIGCCTLYCGDAEEIMPTLAAVDLLLTDPPYGKPGGARHGSYERPSERWRQTPFVRRGTSLPGLVNTPLACETLQRWVEERSRYAIIWGGQYYPLPCQSCWLVWDKQTTGQLSDCELAWTTLPYDSIRRFRWLWNGFAKQRPEPRWHPTQKPLALFQWCLEQAPAPVTSVIDPCAGSGTTAVACAQRGIACTTIEIDRAYWERSCCRLEEAQRQLSLTGVS